MTGVGGSEGRGGEGGAEEGRGWRRFGGGGCAMILR